jgi:hypothetical protein
MLPKIEKRVLGGDAVVELQVVGLEGGEVGVEAVLDLLERKQSERAAFLAVPLALRMMHARPARTP